MSSVRRQYPFHLIGPSGRGAARLIGIESRLVDVEPGTVNHIPVAVRLTGLDSSREPT